MSTLSADSDTTRRVARFVGRITVRRTGHPEHPWMVVCPCCGNSSSTLLHGINNPCGWYNHSLAYARAQQHAMTHLQLQGWVPGPVLPAHAEVLPATWITPDHSSDPAIADHPRFDGHAHLWELVTLLPCADQSHGACAEGLRLVRCRFCHAPRCNGFRVNDPCMERRHHGGGHIHLSGRYEPQGEPPR